jgi:hypothetical protein
MTTSRARARSSQLGTSGGPSTRSSGKSSQIAAIPRCEPTGENQHLRRGFGLLETFERSPENRGVPGSSPGLATGNAGRPVITRSSVIHATAGIRTQASRRPPADLALQRASRCHGCRREARWNSKIVPAVVHAPIYRPGEDRYSQGYRRERGDSDPRPPGPNNPTNAVRVGADAAHERALSGLQLLLLALNLDPA